MTTAPEFKVDRLGFDITLTYGSQAISVSARGYHHHMAINTWNSSGVTPRTPGLGLSVININVPTAARSRLRRGLAQGPVNPGSGCRYRR